MTYEIRWTHAATKRYARLDARAQERVLEAVNSLALNPRPHGAKKLEPKSAGVYALRVGIHLRVLYTIEDATRLILITDASTREGAY